MTHFLIEQAINSNEFKNQLPNITLSTGQLKGAIDINETARKKILAKMKIDVRPLTKHKKIREVLIAEKLFKHKDTSQLGKPISFKYDGLGYENDEYINDGELWRDEFLNLVFYTKEFDKVTGFFAYNLELSRLETITYVNIDLVEIHINHNQVGNEYWVDLTSATISFLNNTLNNIYAQFDSNTEFEIKFNADFNCNKKNRIAKTILRQIRLNIKNTIRKNFNAAVQDCVVSSAMDEDAQYQMTYF